MYNDFLVPCTLLLVLVLLLVILFSVLSSLSAQRNWSKSWRDLAARTGLAYKDTTHGPGVTGMYNGRIISLLGTRRAGMSVLLATNNYNNNHLKLKPKGASAGKDKPLEDLFSVECKSRELKSQLVSSPTLAQRMAPLAGQANASLVLSGEELSYKTPRLVLDVQELIDTLDILCDFSRVIENLAENTA